MAVTWQLEDPDVVTVRHLEQSEAQPLALSLRERGRYRLRALLVGRDVHDLPVLEERDGAEQHHLMRSGEIVMRYWEILRSSWGDHGERS